MKESNGNLVMALELACESQRVDNIVEGRKLVGDFIQKLGVDTVEEYAYTHIDLSDEWEYRRLAEIYQKYDASALIRLIEFGENSSNSEIVETAIDFKTNRSEPSSGNVG